MGRNIVLLSDGTGNSAKAFNKTNVWRLYKALDLGAGDQLAFYDDGVGTSSVKFLQMIGGAFGWGLSRNVRDIYEFLCRYYSTTDTGEPDRIYIFGFSRGAFTARLLADFIIKCGILDRGKEIHTSKFLGFGGGKISIDTDAGLKRGVKAAYKSYRQGYWLRAAWVPRIFSIPFRRLRNGLFDKVFPPDKFKLEYGRKIANTGDGENGHVIEFIGVWDTVDAVGLPIDELSEFLDKRLYPHRFLDQNLSPCVKRAAQALAIDDERQTFHPLLWNEQAGREEDRITQVWFAGMHSNVGGSYADDDLAYVPLAWMIDLVDSTRVANGLVFDSAAVDAIRHRAHSLAKMHDSRSGAFKYYRYRPRYIDDLCWDIHDRVYVSQPKIHHSVFDRIAATRPGYAPVVLPAEYRVVMPGRTLSAAEAPYECDRSIKGTTVTSAELRENRARLLKRARSHVAWRRLSYACFLVLTACLALMPVLGPAIEGGSTTNPPNPPGWITWFSDKAIDWYESAYPVLASFYGAVFDLLAPYLPDFAYRWTSAWVHSPYALTAILIGFIGLVLWRGLIVGRIRHLAETGWRHVAYRETGPTSARDPGIFEQLATACRGWRLGKRVNLVLVRQLAPRAFVFVLVLAIVGVGYRLVIHYPSVVNGVCSRPGALQANAPAETVGVGGPNERKSVTIPFNVETPCTKTGIFLNAGQSYQIDIRTDALWKDLGVEAGIDGFDRTRDNFDLVFLAALPMRRHLTIPWFTLTGEIGRDSGNVFPMNRPGFRFTPIHSGELYIYVNDAINALRISVPIDESQTYKVSSWDAFYCNNSGKGMITVSGE